MGIYFPFTFWVTAESAVNMLRY